MIANAELAAHREPFAFVRSKHFRIDAKRHDMNSVERHAETFVRDRCPA